MGGKHQRRLSRPLATEQQSRKKGTSGRGDSRTERPSESMTAIVSNLRDKISKYRRSDAVKLKGVKDKKLKASLKKSEKVAEDARIGAAMNEKTLMESTGFLVAEGREKTYKFSQEEIRENVDEQSASKIFDLQLRAFGQYSCDFTRNGRYLLLGGEKGHLALLDWSRHNLVKEFHVEDSVRDVHFLQNETLFAVAQRKYVYIYDKQGVELHVLKHHLDPLALSFLPYHYLLVSIGTTGYLKYQDVSTGQLVAEIRTKLGRTRALAQNPHNAVMHVGHSNGTVTLWSPNMVQTTPLVKMLCHKGPVQAVTVRRDGREMATAGLDGQVKIWDLRTYKILNEYFTTTPATTLSYSQQNLLGIGFGPNVQVWQSPGEQKQNAPYLCHRLPGRSVGKLKFCPFEDVLGIAHSEGFSSVLVPGSGEPNFDSYEANPYETKKQRQESEVHSLLEKLRPEMIVLDPSSLGTVDKEKADLVQQQREAELQEKNAARKKRLDARKRPPTDDFLTQTRGRSGSKKRYLRKQQGIVDEKKQKILEEREEREKREKEERRKKLLGESAGAALQRFF